LYTPKEGDVRVTVRLRPEARWVAEYYETSREQELGDGRLEVELPAGRLEWLERLLLRLWPDAEVVDPPDLGERVRELADRTRRRYG
jgi:predicted DNA-binding transcriptional regulator YafY